MITRVHIENFKSVANLDLELGRVNVLIGENGCGKSNLLEAIVLGSAAAHDRMANEFLAPRGVRVTEPTFMQSAFDTELRRSHLTQIRLWDEKGVAAESTIDFEAKVIMAFSGEIRRLIEKLTAVQAEISSDEPLARETNTELEDLMSQLKALIEGQERRKRVPDALIFAPENSALRTFQGEGNILPLGIKGEGLFAHLRALSTSGTGAFPAIVERLSLIDWFESFDIPEDLVATERRLQIRDRYLADGALFDQRSANEGFLFLLFYFTLFISSDTPSFIMIDNVDTSLNPKLCRKLTSELVALAKQHDKQAILTTHNPAILDGLNLHDDEQRLFVVSRNSDGATTARRIFPSKPLGDRPPLAMSEAFLRGNIGGLPDNF